MVQPLTADGKLWPDLVWGGAIANSQYTTTARGHEIVGTTTVLLGGNVCVWGHLPGKEQCNYRAEVYALLMVLLHLNSDGGWQHERLCGY